MTLQQMIDHVPVENDEDVIRHLTAPQLLLKARAINEVAHRRLSSREAVNALTSLLNDTMYFWQPYRICHMARAALHVIGAEPYSEDDDAVIAMIKQFQQ